MSIADQIDRLRDLVADSYAGHLSDGSRVDGDQPEVHAWAGLVLHLDHTTDPSPDPSRHALIGNWQQVSGQTWRYRLRYRLLTDLPQDEPSSGLTIFQVKDTNGVVFSHRIERGMAVTRIAPANGDELRAQRVIDSRALRGEIRIDARAIWTPHGQWRIGVNDAWHTEGYQMLPAGSQHVHADLGWYGHLSENLSEIAVVVYDFVARRVDA